MKLLSPYRVALTLLLACSMTILSCQKEDSISSPTVNAVSEEDAAVYADESTQADASFDDAEDISMTAAEEEGIASTAGRPADASRPVLTFEELRLRIGHCATITVTPNDSTYPKTITIDFGNGCLGPDGKFRSGAIILHLTGPIRRSGSVLTISFRNFHLNRAHIEGTKVISNLSANGNIKFTVQVTGGKLTFPTGRGYSFESLKYVKQVAGAATAIVRDDVYTIEGRSKTVFNNGVTVILDTETPLVKKIVCPWISNGTLKIKINDRVLFLDYGAPNSGDCDNKALLSWNNGANQRLITLP